MERLKRASIAPQLTIADHVDSLRYPGELDIDQIDFQRPTLLFSTDFNVGLHRGNPVSTADFVTMFRFRYD